MIRYNTKPELRHMWIKAFVNLLSLIFLFKWRPLLIRGSTASAVETRGNYWYKIKTCDVKTNQIYHCVIKSDYHPSAPE